MSRRERRVGKHLLAKYWLWPALFCVMLPRLNYSDSSSLYPASSLGWREAAPGYEFSFPRDHAAHPESRVEWWYYTGNLQSKTGRRFGYQLTFFRVGVTRDPGNTSRWALRDLYMAHFAISDIDTQTLRSFERINRAGIGWAGADTFEQGRPAGEQHRTGAPIRVWNEDWSAQIEGSSHALQATEEGYSIDLKLPPSKREVIHGNNGISQKGPSPGNASHYYSLSRAESSGQLSVAGETFEVTGQSWMDHEFGTSFLDEEQVGWDWFSIQLEDGRDLMLFEIRRRDGSIDPRSSGTMIEATGGPTHLSYEDFSLVPAKTWRSPNSGASYPIAWKIELPRYGLRLNVTAAFEDQELRTPESTRVTYWEGSVEIEGSAEDKKIRGRGYLEMTGYAGQNMGAMLR